MRAAAVPPKTTSRAVGCASVRSSPPPDSCAAAMTATPNTKPNALRMPRGSRITPPVRLRPAGAVLRPEPLGYPENVDEWRRRDRPAKGSSTARMKSRSSAVSTVSRSPGRRTEGRPDRSDHGEAPIAAQERRHVLAIIRIDGQTRGAPQGVGRHGFDRAADGQPAIDDMVGARAPQHGEHPVRRIQVDGRIVGRGANHEGRATGVGRPDVAGQDVLGRPAHDPGAARSASARARRLPPRSVVASDDREPAHPQPPDAVAEERPAGRSASDLAGRRREPMRA